jgi:ABC-type lipopolysaccharide export system ATPase subunit
MVIDVIRDIAEYIPLDKGFKLSAESLLERFLFPRPQQRVLVSQLSGGEKRRLYLLTILMKNPNFSFWMSLPMTWTSSRSMFWKNIYWIFRDASL